MIHCRRCQRTSPSGTETCECGADLTVDGISMGETIDGDAAPTAQLPDLPDLPDLDASGSGLGDNPFADAGNTPQAKPPTPLGSSHQEVVTPKSAPEPSGERRHRFAVQPGSPADAATGEVPQPKVDPAPDPRQDRGAAPTPPIAPQHVASVYEDQPVGQDNPAAASSGAAPLRNRLDVPPPPGPGEIACPSCGRPTPEERRFCTCGTALTRSDPDAPEATDDDPAQTWWRRVTGTGVGARGDQRTWGQRAKDTGARKGMRYASAVSAQTRMGRIAMAVLAGGGILMLLGPLRSYVKRVPDLFTSEAPAELQPNEVSYFDGPPPWQGRWDPTELGLGLELVESEECGQSGAAAGQEPALSGQFTQPTDITAVWVTVGDTRASTAEGEDPGSLLQPSHPPNVLEVTIGEQCRVLDIVDSPETQKFDINADGATLFEIVVVGVHGVAWDVAPTVQIESITWIKK